VWLQNDYWENSPNLQRLKMISEKFREGSNCWAGAEPRLHAFVSWVIFNVSSSVWSVYDWQVRQRLGLERLLIHTTTVTHTPCCATDLALDGWPCVVVENDMPSSIHRCLTPCKSVSSGPVKPMTITPLISYSNVKVWPASGCRDAAVPWEGRITSVWLSVPAVCTSGCLSRAHR